MKLYNYWRSSASWRVRIALAFKNVAYEYIAVNLVEKANTQDDYRALNPIGQVTTLVLEDGRQLSQSLAILEWLEETAPRPSLLPADPYLRARARQLAEIVNSGIQPFQNLPLISLYTEHGLAATDIVRGHISRGLDALQASAEPHAG